MLRFVALALSALLLVPLLCALACPAAADNENTAFVMHAMNTSFMPCDAWQTAGVDCETTLPTVNLFSFQNPAFLLLVRNYDDVAGIQLALDIDSSWVFIFDAWDCRPGLVNYSGATPPWGPHDGTLRLDFDPVAGGGLAPIGRMHFATAMQGCVEIIESAYSHGTWVIDSANTITHVAADNRGKVCMGVGGYDACSPAAVPVENRSWGAVKAHYR